MSFSLWQYSFFPLLLPVHRIPRILSSDVYVKLPGHPVRTGLGPQAETPPIPLWRVGARSGQKNQFSFGWNDSSGAKRHSLLPKLERRS